MTSLFTKRERSLIFSPLKKSSFFQVNVITKFPNSMIFKRKKKLWYLNRYYLMIFIQCYYLVSIKWIPSFSNSKHKLFLPQLYISTSFWVLPLEWFKFAINCFELFYIFVNKLIAKTFHIHSEPKLAESLLQQKANLIFSALTVAVNDKIQDPYLHTPNAGQNLLIFLHRNR